MTATGLIASPRWPNVQDGIVYFPGLSFQFLFGEIERIGPGFDMDLNSAEDFAFQQGYFVCTADVPVSGCSSPFYVTPSGSNSIIVQQFGQATILPFGALIGDSTPTNSTWSNLSRTATVAAYYISPRFDTNALVGPLPDAGIGYLGVRIDAQDGPHYGWIRLQSAPFVGVVDWAYNTHPNVPILAGAIGSQSDSLQFRATFHGPNHRLPHPFGTFILTGNSLRCELTLAGLFSSADVVRAGLSRAHVKSIANLGEPLAQRADFTSFFGNVTLSDSQIVELLRGGLYVSIDQGAVMGRISLVK